MGGDEFVVVMTDVKQIESVAILAHKVLEAIFNADPLLQVAGHAKDGREAVALAESLKPDVITMDINMPHMDGLQATTQIMTTNPRPIPPARSISICKASAKTCFAK